MWARSSAADGATALCRCRRSPERVCRCPQPQTRRLARLLRLWRPPHPPPTRATAGRDERVSRSQAGSPSSPTCDLLVCLTNQPRTHFTRGALPSKEPRPNCRKYMPHSDNFEKYLRYLPGQNPIRLRTNADRIERTNGHLRGEPPTYVSRNTPPLTSVSRIPLVRCYIATILPLLYCYIARAGLRAPWGVSGWISWEIRLWFASEPE